MCSWDEHPSCRKRDETLSLKCYALGCQTRNILENALNEHLGLVFQLKMGKYVISLPVQGRAVKFLGDVCVVLHFSFQNCLQCRVRGSM